MLRIYICPKCYNFRMVTRKPDAVCLHCGMTLELSEIVYGDFINMTEKDREEFKENYKKRMLLYSDKILQVHSINNERTFL